jgi:hypothetical protein
MFFFDQMLNVHHPTFGERAISHLSLQISCLLFKARARFCLAFNRAL